MAAVAVAGFDWDAGNLAKCQTHGVTIAEIESVFRSRPAISPDLAHSVSETRFLAIGVTRSGRYVFVAFTRRIVEERALIRPISARYMHAKEARRYEGRSEISTDPDER